MNLLTIKKRSLRSKPNQPKKRWLWLPSEFGISGIFMSTRDIHPLTELFRAIYFNRYENATLPYKESLQHFSSTIWRRWGYWPSELLKPIFDRLETTVESELKENGGWVGWVQCQLEKEINFQRFIVGVQEEQTLDDVLFEAAIEQARGAPNQRFHPLVWEAANNLSEQDKQKAKKAASLCQDDSYLSPILDSSKLPTGRQVKNGRVETKFIPLAAS